MEIVAPAGEYSKLESAILGGANAVYLGLKGFGARRKAGNFTLEELKTAIDFAHIHNVKVYLTLNTILKDIEIENLYENLKTIYEYGIDAFIVQDLGVFCFLKKNFPEAEFHASTQMTVSNYREAQFLKDLGFSRVVLARELSLAEITSIKKKVDIDLEIFVSGVLCLSYSGNCYLSSFIGSRSGNRGLCAQPCRKKYVNSQGEEAYFLSPKDQLLKKEEINALMEIGVESIKIEGRMKSEEYVFELSSYYREILENLGVREERVSKLFNRGYSKGYFYGEDKDLINKNYSSDLGLYLGKIQGNKLKLEEDLQLGDGIVYLDKNFEKISGTYINKIMVENKEQVEAKKGDELTLARVKNALYVYKNFDKKTMDAIKHEMKTFKRREGIKIYLYAHCNENLILELDAWGHKVKVVGDPLVEAKKTIEADKIIEKLAELGDTVFYAENINLDYDNKAFVAFSYLKQLRREASQLLLEKIKSAHRRIAPVKWFLENKINNQEDKNKITAVVKEEWQKKLLLDLGIEEVHIKNPDIAREELLERVDLNNALCSNFYQLLENKKSKLKLDWNQNISNSYACYLLSDLEKLDTITISPELKKEDLEKIYSFRLNKELLIYSHLRLMYLETEIAEDELINKEGDKFILIKNSLGNTEIYLKEAMNLIPKLDLIKKINYEKLRLEFNFESEEEIREIVKNLDIRKGKYMPYNFEKGVY